MDKKSEKAIQNETRASEKQRWTFLHGHPDSKNRGPAIELGENVTDERRM